MLDEQDRLVDFVYDRQVLAKVLQGEEEEQKERKRLQLEHEQLAVMQKQQLEEYKQRYINELREVRGELYGIVAVGSMWDLHTSAGLGKARRRADETENRAGSTR